jgi:site-specific recombinase XerD
MTHDRTALLPATCPTWLTPANRRNPCKTRVSHDQVQITYGTHLVEDGFDALFVQQQVGHEHSSTTSLYTAVSSDYRTRMLRTALDGAVARAGPHGGGL